MSNNELHHTRHTIDVHAPADVVFELIAEARKWPQRMPPNVHVEQLVFDGTTERLRMWATANGIVKSWTSRREFDWAARKIEFAQEISASPVQSMGGTWLVESDGADNTTLILLHHFSVADNAPEAVEWVRSAVDGNSTAELANLKSVAESHHRLGELEFDFIDTVTVNADARTVYDFLYAADQWPQRLPHVAALHLVEDEPGLQLMRMDTSTADGSTHTTESVRVCFAEEGRIVYKQTTTPALMTVHTGEWTVLPTASGCTVSSRHTVVLRESAIPNVLGADATTETAREYVHTALSRNSTATMTLAKEFAEGHTVAPV